MTPSPRAAADAAVVRVVPKHHLLVRLSHWLNIPLLFGLLVTGLSIYWAAPVFIHPWNPVTHTHDGLADVSVFIARLLHDTHDDPRNWIYNHFSLGTSSLASALQIHWLFAYLFMINGAFYLLGLAAGGGWRALLPRGTDPAEAVAMLRYYLGVVPALLLRKPNPHPQISYKYNALQRAAYFSMPIFGLLIVASGWAMHKPAMLGWLVPLFINYDGARIVHFVSMVVLGSFVVPHVLLVIADGFDTFRSMITGWSTRVKEDGDGHA